MKKLKEMSQGEAQGLFKKIARFYTIDLLSLKAIVKKTGLTRGMVYYCLLKAGVVPFNRQEWELERRKRRLIHSAKSTSGRKNK